MADEIEDDLIRVRHTVVSEIDRLIGATTTTARRPGRPPPEVPPSPPADCEPDHRGARPPAGRTSLSREPGLFSQAPLGVGGGGWGGDPWNEKTWGCERGPRPGAGGVLSGDRRRGLMLPDV